MIEHKHISEIAKKNNINIYNAYMYLAAAFDEAQQTNPKSWQGYQGGEILNLYSSNWKCDGARTIEVVISDMIESGEGKESNAPTLCKVCNIIEVDDEEILLYPYNQKVPEDCAGGWFYPGLEDDPKFDTEKHKYENVTRVTMLKSPNYCVFIDSEGYDYCRYVFFLYDWREMFSEVVDTINQKREQREAEEAAQEFVEQSKRALEYSTRCQRWADLMEQIKKTEYNDPDYKAINRKGKAAQRKNVLKMLHTYFPGQKFSVTYEHCWSSSLNIEWTDGPTVEEVEATDVDLFQRSTIYFDGMTDSTEYGHKEFSEFAEMYAYDDINRIEFVRNASNEAMEPIKKDVESCMTEEEKDKGVFSDERARELYNIFGLDPKGLLQYTINFNILCREVFDKYSLYTPPAKKEEPTAKKETKEPAQETECSGLSIVEIPGGVAVVGDYRTTYRNRKEIKSHGAQWNKEAKQWQCLTPESVASVRNWLQ